MYPDLWPLGTRLRKNRPIETKREMGKAYSHKGARELQQPVIPLSED